MRRWLALALALSMTACAATSQVRYPPARWLVDRDRKPVKLPQTREEYDVADVVNYQFFYQLERATNLGLRGERALYNMGFNTKQESLNTNNFDEVADSSWFTNRLGRRPMTVEELRRGPNTGTGPDPQGPWTVVRAKTEGKTPGIMIEDSRGDKYLLKFDPPGSPELVSAAETIATKIVYAMGYNLAENYIVEFHPDILRISPRATTKTRYGKTIPFAQADLEALFRRIAEKGDGRYRALASKIIEGKILGPTTWRGRRWSDKNDHMPHEHRRELRGYAVVSALLNNSDTKEANTLDTFIKTGPGEKGYVRHYMLDLGNSLGSASQKPKAKEHLDDYRFNLKKVGASFFSFGAYQPDWERVEDPGMESVGIYESKYFEPAKWRPAYPHPGFQNMTYRDAFWAAKILTKLSDEDIRAIVAEGRYSDPEAADYIAKTLIERRNKIGSYWLSRVNPLDNFRLEPAAEGQALAFDDLLVQAGLAPAGSATYRYRVIQDRGAYDLLDWTETQAPSASLPADLLGRMKPEKTYLLQLETRRSGEEFWGPAVDVILEKSGELRILGLNRRYR
ncbi:MAG TPA: hypothetical protein VJR29_02210 [bacterium]|nr:hypothetical protein [bacterium]